MITIDFANTGIDTAPHADKIPEFLKKIEARNQGFYTVIDDESVLEKLNGYANATEGQFEHIVVLGIGGSALGTITLRDALTHLFPEARKSPRLHVLDNIDPELIRAIDDVIEYEKTLFIVVSKSGGTAETLAQYHYFRKKCENKKLPVTKHFVFITGPQKNAMREISNAEGISALDVPENVGGRFSVLTAVSLLPAKLTGIKVEELLDGAREMRESFLSENLEKNLPFRLAAAQFELAKKGRTITVMMPYSQKLKTFADWYAQLLAESTGKDGKGLTPVSALGVTDQHSQLQLFSDGPDDKLIIFINVKNRGPELQIPGFMNGSITFGKLIDAEFRATRDALGEKGRPNLTIEIDEVSERTLGGLFMLFCASIAFLGEFFNINAFDQPGVERSKTLTKEYLSK